MIDNSTVDYYVVRIYRKAPADGAQERVLVGMVEMTETGGGEQRAFHSIEELWGILAGPGGESEEGGVRS